MMETREITEADAIEICSWKYEGMYSIYNYSAYEICKENEWDIADDEVRKRTYVSVYDEGKLFGFFNIMDREDHIELGVGMNPDKCGHHYGRKFMQLAVATAGKRYPEKKIILKVRPFNKRAIKCYEGSGFKITGEYYDDTLFIPGEMLIMEYQNTDLKENK